MGDALQRKMPYLPALDGLRFIAFFLVFIHHVGALPLHVYFFPAAIYNTISAWGWVGVDLFFVLSGFLITSLLLIERENTGQVSFKNFFIRRTLRIWPLYFLALISGTVILYFLYQQPSALTARGWHHDWLWYISPYFVFAGNVVSAVLPPAPFVSMVLGRLWSVALEEQYYVFWGVTMARVSRFRMLAVILLALLTLSVVARFLLWQNAEWHSLYSINTVSRLDALALGSLLAIAMQKGWLDERKIEPWKHWLFPASVLLPGIIFTCFAPLEQKHVSIVPAMLLVAVACLLLLMATLFCEQWKRWIAYGPLREMGKMTYGLYIFHPIGIYLAEFVAKPYLPADGGIAVWWVRLLGGFAMTLLLAYLSWHWYEKRFMAMKTRFSAVQYEKGQYEAAAA